MSRIQILNERRFPLKVDKSDALLPYHRFEHRVTLGRRAREFMVFVDNITQKLYIEEITGGHLSFIEDEGLFQELYRFANLKGFCSMIQTIYKK
jgi:hypothetical protein